MIEMKPCPFCGGTDLHLESFSGWGADVIVCPNCLSVFSQQEITCEEDLVEAWNKRTKSHEKNICERKEKSYDHTFCNMIILRGQDVCVVKDTCEGCKMNPKRCAIYDMLEKEGTLDNWKDMDLPNFRERE